MSVLQEQQRRKEAEEAAGVERVDVFGRHIKAKRVDGSYRAMENAEKVDVQCHIHARDTHEHNLDTMMQSRPHVVGEIPAQ